MQAVMLGKLKDALNKKLEEFEEKSKVLATENTKFEQGKVNMLSSMQNNMNFKKLIHNKLENARSQVEETQHEHIALQRTKDETEANLTKIQQELEKTEKDKHFIDRISSSVMERKNQEYGQRMKTKEELESDAKDELKRLNVVLEKERNRLRELQEQAERAKAELDDIEKRISQKELEAKNNDELDELEKQRALLEADLKKIKADIAKAQIDLQNLKDKNDDLQAQIDKQIKENQNAELEVENAKRQLEEMGKLEKEIEKQQVIRDDLKDKCKDLQRQIEEVEKAIHEIQGKNEELVEHNETIQLLIQYERELKRVVNELQELESKIFGYNQSNDLINRVLGQVHAQLTFQNKESFFDNAHSQMTKVDLPMLKKNISSLQIDFDKFKRQVQDILNGKLHEKDITTNTAALKKDIKTQISVLLNINEQIDQVTNQDVTEIETIIEHINATLKAEEVKAKEAMIQTVLSHTEAEANKVQEMVTQVKNLQRERAKIERAIKLKMECVKQPSQKDRLFKIMLKLFEVQEYLLATKFFQNERDQISNIQSTSKSLSAKSELSKILELLEDHEYFQFQLKQAQSDMKDYEFSLSQVRSQYEDLDGQLTIVKQNELYERIKLINVQTHQGELTEVNTQLTGWRKQVNDFRQKSSQNRTAVSKPVLEMVDMFDKECELAQEVVSKSQKDYQRVQQNVDNLLSQLSGKKQDDDEDQINQSDDPAPAEKPDKMSELAKIDFSLEKTEERYKDSNKYNEHQVQRQYKAVQLKWIDVEDAVKSA